jgi:hypothetical protein
LTCVRAAENGHTHVLEWARAQDPPCPRDSHLPLSFGEKEEEMFHNEMIDEFSSLRIEPCLFLKRQCRECNFTSWFICALRTGRAEARRSLLQFLSSCPFELGPRATGGV